MPVNDPVPAQLDTTAPCEVCGAPGHDAGGWILCDEHHLADREIWQDTLTGKAAEFGAAIASIVGIPLYQACRNLLDGLHAPGTHLEDQ